jgi:hypothetical protein
MNSDRTPLPICHPKQLLPISIKIQCGIELVDDFLILAIVEAHHLCHLQLVTSSHDFVKGCVPPSSYPILVHPLGLHHWPHLMEIDRTVPIRLEKRPKLRIMGLLATFIHRGFTIVIDCARLCLLGISDGHVGGPLNRCMPLKHFMVFLIFIARVRGVVMWTWRRRSMSYRCLAGATLLGGPSCILMVLGPFLTMRIHPEIRRIEEELDNND